MTYDNIKGHKKPQGFNLSLENTFLEKPQGSGAGVVNLIPYPFKGYILKSSCGQFLFIRDIVHRPLNHSDNASVLQYL